MNQGNNTFVGKNNIWEFLSEGIAAVLNANSNLRG